MVAVLHCIVTETVKKLSEHIYNWKQNTDSNKLIQETENEKIYESIKY